MSGRAEAGPVLAPGQGDQREPADHPRGAERQRDCARADQRNEEKRRAERPHDRAGGRNAVDGAGDHARALRGSQQEPDREWRINPEQGYGEKHDGQRREQAAEADIVDVGEHEFEHAFGKGWQQHEIGRGDQHDRPEHSRGGGAVSEPAAEEIPGRERDQHR